VYAIYWTDVNSSVVERLPYIWNVLKSNLSRFRISW